MGRVAAWRIYNRVARLSGDTKIGSLYFGGRVECDLRDIIGQYIFHFGVWEPHVSALVVSRLKPGDVFCDIGANIGYYSVLAGVRVGDQGSVIAIEPSPGIFEQLRRNVDLAAVRSVRLVKSAVGADEGTVTLYPGPAPNRGLTTIVPNRATAGEQRVEMHTLDAILTAEERRRLRLVKIDVEGAERPILKSLLATLDRYSQQLEVVAEVAPTRALDEGWTVGQVVDEFAQHGFRAFAVPNSYSLESYLDLRAPLAPAPVDREPTRQQDIFFSRGRP